jgi:ribosomal protein L34E
MNDDPERIRALASFIRTVTGVAASDIQRVHRHHTGCKWCGAPLKIFPGYRPATFCPPLCKNYAGKLWHSFRLRVEQVHYMLDSQSNTCAACGTALETYSTIRRYPIDHCHTTGLIRGVVHDPCNCALGLLGDDPVRIERLATYLETYTPLGIIPSMR